MQRYIIYQQMIRRILYQHITYMPNTPLPQLVQLLTAYRTGLACFDVNWEKMSHRTTKGQCHIPQMFWLLVCFGHNNDTLWH
mgnify:CR=1 FL=1